MNISQHLKSIKKGQMKPEEYKILSQLAVGYIKKMSSFPVVEELRLLESPKFIAFITDIMFNTLDFSNKSIEVFE